MRRLLEITERECNQELFFSVKNLQELGVNPFRYILVIPRSLPKELAKGEHFVLANLLKLILSRSSQAGPTQEPRAEVAERGLVSFVQLDQLPLAERDSHPVPQATKKKRKKVKRARQTKASDEGLEGFLDWLDLGSTEPVKEGKMSNLTAGFAVRMHKQAVSAQGEANPGSEALGGKRRKQCGSVNPHMSKLSTIFQLASFCI